MKHRPRTPLGAVNVFTSPLASRARTVFATVQAAAPSSRRAKASIHLPFSSASSVTAPSARSSITRPSSPPLTKRP